MIHLSNSAGIVSSLALLALAISACGAGAAGAPAPSEAPPVASPVAPPVASSVASPVAPAVASPVAPGSLPSASLEVPAGNALALRLQAKGVQVYACQSGATGFAWTLKAPDAVLNEADGRAVGKHFAGPTWQDGDGSQVVGSKVSSFSVDAKSIPWLLLQAKSHEGSGRLADVTYIQRLDTAGGLAPEAGCDASHIGASARAPYTAVYAFYKKARP